MKTLALFLLILLAHVSYSQKFRKEEIYQKGQGVNRHVLYSNLFLDQNDSVTSKEVILAGQDSRYTRIVSTVICYKGTADQVVDFMDLVEDFYKKNETNTFQEINGVRVRRAKFGIGISGTDGSGEAGFDIKSWGKIKAALIEWKNKN